MPTQLARLVENLKALGPRRLAALAAALAICLAVFASAAFVLNRPAYEVLYVGLDRDDANRIALALGEAGIPYEVGSDGSSVAAEAGRLAQARMILAEKGLPGSASAGYELFDSLGSLGLTSFMQEVTRVRALEGEIARSVVAINGVRSARVHIVMGDQGSFRRASAEPTASVIVRSNGADLARAATAIRHLVAAAVPGLSTDNVTVLDASGQLLAAGADPANGTATAAMTVQQRLESEIASKIAATLSPQLGPDNFRASVQATVNTDQRQIEETTFDPASRVERSVQVVRAEDSSTETSAASAVTVEQNLPEDVQEQGASPQSAEKSERREETTSYEINSRRTATVSNGYRLEKLSVSVVVNAGRLKALAGPDADPTAIEARMADIRAIVAAAAGFDEARGDTISIVAGEFLEPGNEGMVTGSLASDAAAHLGTVVNALAFLAAVLVVTLFGLRPLVAVLREAPPGSHGSAGKQLEAGAEPTADQALSTTQGNAPAGSSTAAATRRLVLDTAAAPQDRLGAIVDLDERRSAEVLRRWVQEAAA